MVKFKPFLSTPKTNLTDVCHLGGSTIFLLRNPVNSPVQVGRFFPLVTGFSIYRVLYIARCFFLDFFHQQTAFLIPNKKLPSERLRWMAETKLRHVLRNLRSAWEDHVGKPQVFQRWIPGLRGSDGYMVWQTAPELWRLEPKNHRIWEGTSSETSTSILLLGSKSVNFPGWRYVVIQKKIYPGIGSRKLILKP